MTFEGTIDARNRSQLDWMLIPELKPVMQAELDAAGIEVGPIDSAKGWLVWVLRTETKDRMVEEVTGFHAQLQPMVLSDARALHGSKVKMEATRGGEKIHLQVPELAWLWIEENLASKSWGAFWR